METMKKEESMHTKSLLIEITAKDQRIKELEKEEDRLAKSIIAISINKEVSKKHRSVAEMQVTRLVVENNSLLEKNKELESEIESIRVKGWFRQIEELQEKLKVAVEALKPFADWRDHCKWENEWVDRDFSTECRLAKKALSQLKPEEKK